MANTGPLKIPDALTDAQVLFLSDILPTAYQAVLNAQVEPGGSVAIFGAGPVGLLAAACARQRGAERIFMIDHHPDRLQFAAQAYGVEAINFDEIDDPAKMIVEMTHFRGVDASVDAVGFEAKGSALETALTAVKLEGSSGRCRARRLPRRAVAVSSACPVSRRADAVRGYEMFDKKQDECRKVILTTG